MAITATVAAAIQPARDDRAAEPAGKLTAGPNPVPDIVAIAVRGGRAVAPIEARVTCDPD
jgi:hypothetical protein